MELDLSHVFYQKTSEPRPISHVPIYQTVYVDENGFQIPNNQIQSDQHLDQPTTSQAQITQKNVAELGVKVDQVLWIMERMAKQAVAKDNDYQNKCEEIDKIEMCLPLKSVADIEILDTNLGNTVFFYNFRNLINFHIGTKNIPNTGIDCAYVVIDKIFSRDVLLNFTWTGYSSKGPKKAFSKYENILKVFFKAIYRADNSYSMSSNQRFFQYQILKYARSRAAQARSKRKIQSKSRKVTSRRRNNNNSGNDIDNVMCLDE